MSKQRVEHPTTYKTRMAADRMSVLLVIDRPLLAPYTKAAADAKIDRNSILVAALKQALEGKQHASVNADVMVEARAHNGNTSRSATLRARQDAAQARHAKSSKAGADGAATDLLTQVKEAVKLKKAAVAAAAKKAKAKAKVTAKPSKPSAKKAAKKPAAKLSAKPSAKASASANGKPVPKSKNKAAGVPASAKTKAKPAKATKAPAGTPKRATKPERLIGVDASKAEQMYIDDGSKSATPELPVSSLQREDIDASTAQ